MVGARCISIYIMIVLQTAPFRNGTLSLSISHFVSPMIFFSVVVMAYRFGT